MVGGRLAALRQPPPVDRGLRRAREADRADPDAPAPDRHDVRPRPRRLARGGRAPRPDVELMRPGGPDRVLFRADGSFTRLRFSPSGRWLLVAWPLADQWVYLRPGADGARRLLATPGVSRRFGSRGFPQLSGWCCPP